MASPQMKERPSGVVLNTISKGASPESKCPICLDHYKNISYLDVCLHKFCFCCIREWSKNKAECPLCKQPFNSIYHTIKSEDNYQKFDLRPTENGSFGNMAGQRFRYRTTLTGERRPAPRRTSSPPDHGVLFEGLRGSVPQRHNRDLHSMLRRLAEERQRREREGRSLRSLQEQQAVKFRRALYRRGVRVQNVEDGGRSRETSAEFFRRNPACLHRLVPWVKRELTVLYGSHGSLANIVQHIIMTLITRHNLDEQPVLHELRPFLLTHTEHFLHEFLSFARSPFNMEAYDQRAVYDLPQASGEISRSETSVISISEDESDALVSGSQDYGTPSVTLSQAPWDDETPGPSYSSETSQVLPFHVRDSDSDSSVGEAVESVTAVPHQDRLGDPGTLEEEPSSGSDEDCVIVGYVKPALERTPELVLLSSDSEPSEQNAEPQSPDLTPADTQRNTSSRSREDKSGERHHERQLSGSRNRSSRSTRTHSSSHGREHQLSKKSKHKRRRENESSFHSSYSHYSQRDRSGRCYTETCSSYTSHYRSVHRSRSQSHRKRRSRDRQERRRSRSNSRINSSNRQDRSNSRSNSRINSSNRHSRSNSRMNSSNRQDRSNSMSNSRINSSNRRSRSNSRINSSNRQDRSNSRSNSRINSSNRHSRSNSRINSSNRQDRSNSMSNSRINSSNRQDRSNSRINSSNRRSRSNSRINSSNRQDRSNSRSNSRINSSNRHSRSNSRINSSNRQDRSNSRSNSRINSSNRQDRSNSRSNSRINSSNRQDRSNSRSNSRINSSNRQDRSNSRSNSRINSSNRQDRSNSRSNSRINSTNRHSRSNSRINSSSHQTSHHDDHGRKKKYKMKHHEEPSRKSSSQLVTDSIDDGAKKKTKKHKKFKRKSRSPSIDDRSEGHGRKHHKKKKNKKKNKRKSRKLSGEKRLGKNSPVFITIPSDSDEADPSEPSARNISAADSTVTIAHRATDSQPLDVEQDSAAGAEWSSVCDAGNRPPDRLMPV
ncbi:E3 ubiquitin-protein ligase Topors-like [Carassius auratus]|uniref:E3 ubiquitin-protein ligase Topors n=1 Tax=Carassius auratus TaxID=7957 RepID=A0A6P6Q3E5_CARAU|nr:E3 ubiquitin-protein ligase Topors-like [Carassius auratus]